MDEVFAVIYDGAELAGYGVIIRVGFFQQLQGIGRLIIFCKLCEPGGILFVVVPGLAHFCEILCGITGKRRCNGIKRDINLITKLFGFLSCPYTVRQSGCGNDGIFSLPVVRHGRIAVRSCKHALQMFCGYAHRTVIDFVQCVG